MDHVTLHLENCYGIKKLDHTFDFSSRKVYAIYAPNGSMKSSFAQTFKDIADGKPSEDRIFPDRATVREVKDETGAELQSASVLVLPPYDEMFGADQAKTSTLLVNAPLRKEFEQLYADVEKSKNAFLKAMATQARSKKKQLADEIALTFMKAAGDDYFYQALDRIKNELADQKDAPLADVPYDTIFNDAVLDALGTKSVRSALESFVKRYNALLSASTFFKTGIFEYYNASQIAKALADNGFFKAQHTITLHGGATHSEITSQKQLEDLVNTELRQMASDPELLKLDTQIKKHFEKNVTLRDFRQYISDSEFLLPQLANLDLFRENVWKSYFKANQTLYDDLMGCYYKARARRKEIEEQAQKERTHWESAIALFNDRFFVPFRLEAKNKIAVTLGKEPILDLTYTFIDKAATAPVSRANLLRTLSQGEKKALYILNVIFEIGVRRQAKQETLFVVDDIADSFDYKNKYAIIQYLQDIGDGPVFKQIILTHNFDFFRTLNSRFVGYPGCLMTVKDDSGIALKQAQGIENVFVNDWKKDFSKNTKKRVACIPFMRNLIEYTRGEGDPDYVTLTSLLHWRSDSLSITDAALQGIYNRLFGGVDKSPSPKKPVIDIIQDAATACLSAGHGVNFEHKIVLSIATRLAAERFMATKIADAAFLDSIKKSQTQHLLKRYQKDFPSELEAIRTLLAVTLMTPENIHLNAFMYEPILDMSDDHLRKLYADVLSLK